jgi:probable rRNA maturation factor
MDKVPTVRISVERSRRQWSGCPATRPAVLKDLARSVLASVLNELSPDPLPVFQIGVLLVSDRRMGMLNQTWRNKKGPTNVLSFHQFDSLSAIRREAARQPLVCLGDIVMSNPTVRQEACTLNRSPGHHAAHLFVHGMLHLLGFDHTTPAAAQDMEAREIRCLEKAGIPDPYVASHLFVQEAVPYV